MRISIIVALVAGILVVAVLLLNRPRLITIDAAIPENFPADGFSHDVLEQLLHTYVDGAGDVDYERWQQNTPDLQRLESYLAAVSRYSPESTPERFKTKQNELAYWLYAYNAYVLKSILDRWPLASVTSVKAPIEIVKGLGFFYQLRFLFGGKQYSLYAVENDIIRANYRDARIHFVLNCGRSYLQQAAVDFVSDRRNVSIDHDKKEIVLSTIFKWFRKDFINDLRRRGLSSDRGLIDYVASVAPASLRDELLGTINYEIVYIDYDWAVNQHK
jgi:hypothetical protein